MEHEVATGLGVGSFANALISKPQADSATRSVAMGYGSAASKIAGKADGHFAEDELSIQRNASFMVQR